MDPDNIVLEAVRSAIAELEEVEREYDVYSAALDRLRDAERILTGEEPE